MRIGGFIVTVVFCISSAAGQGVNDFIEKSLTENDISKKLPSLDSLMNLAVERSSKVKFYKSDETYWESQRVLQRTSWLRYITIDANYNYGIFDNLSNQQLAGDPQASQALFTTEQSRYSGGVSLKLPLFALANKKTAKKATQAEIDKARYLRESFEDEVKEAVVLRYTQLLKAHRLFFVTGAMMDTYKVQSARAEKDFTNGIIDVSEYTRLQQMYNDAIRSYESQRSEFLLAYMYLESIIGIELNI